MVSNNYFVMYKQQDVQVENWDNIRMDLKKPGWENVDWFHLMQDKHQ
jgi:hypothetical protein